MLKSRYINAVMRGLDPIGANLSLATNLSLVMPRFKRGTQ